MLAMFLNHQNQRDLGEGGREEGVYKEKEGREGG